MWKARKLTLGALAVLGLVGCAAVPPRDTGEVRRRLLAEKVRSETGVDIAQEAETRRDHGVALLIRLDSDERDRQHVAALGAFDIDRPRHRMDQIEVNRSQIGRN